MAQAESSAMQMAAVLAKQKASFLRDGAPSAKVRIDRLNRCIALLIEHAASINEALDADFGNRAPEVTGITDVAGSIGPLKHAKAHLEK